MHESRLSTGIEQEAAPRPVLRMVDESASYGLGVHVVQLFALLLAAPDIEIEKTRLPESPWQMAVLRERKRKLMGIGFAPLGAQAPGAALLQHLHDAGRCASARFAD